MLKIVVVEDEVIVAKDIQKTLIKLGFEVPAIAATATQAFERIKEIRPDLVLCDIKLKGDIDGIEVASRVNELYKIPVIYLTSYSDRQTLDRAKVTQPYGYIIKPFNDADLLSAVEMAIYKFNKDKAIQQSEERLSNTLNWIDETIVITDDFNIITYVNPRFETFFNVDPVTSVGKKITDLIEFDATISLEELLESKLRQTHKHVNCKLITTNETYRLNISVIPISNEQNEMLGRSFVFNSDEERNWSNQRSTMDNNLLNDSFYIKRSSQLVKVKTDNILWIQAMDNYVIIQSTTDQFIIHSTMKEIEAKLPQALFVRVHRSYIVNLSQIQLIEENDDDVLVQEPAKVILFNDEVHSFEEVIGQIIKATGCDIHKAEALTWEVHFNGKAVVYSGEMIRCLQVSHVLEEIQLMTQIEV